MALQLRARSKILPNPPIRRFFSDGPGPNPQSPEPDNPNPQTPQSSFTSYFSDVKARLKQQEQQPLHRQQQRRMPTNPPSFRSSAATKPQPSWASSFEEIKKNISEFRRRSAAPVPGAEPSNAKPVEFSELYRRNVTSTGEVPESGSAEPFGKPSFDAIRDSVKKIGSRGNARRERVPAVDTLSLSRLKDTLRMRPPEDSGPKVIGGGEPLPMDIFGKEMRAKQEGKQSHDKMKREFLEMYSHSELGKRLKELRPKSVDGFSLHELNDRLVKLREMEEKMPRSPFGVTILRDLRESLETLSQAEEDKKRKSSPFKLDQLVHLGRTPDFMLHPPKEHLVEKYFHPDNMSSSEKLKIELAKVRDEFKLSESDCGSARVQVAQLTTKIKHLASVLHKKDKHSRKGLEQMVQKRKKLLKYLRRTDWESYTFVLSKLGLRDNPDIKIKH